MSSTIRYFIVIAILSLSSYATAGILMYDSAENSPPSSTWEYNIGAMPSGMSITLSSDHALSGSHSYKVYMPATEPGNYDTGAGDLHVELLSATKVSDERWNHNFTFDQTYWISWNIYIPSDFQFPNTSKGYWLLAGQWHNSLDSCDADGNPPAGFLIQSDGRLVMTIKGISAHCSAVGDYERVQTYTSPNALIKGQWNQIVTNFRFSYNPNGGGFFKCWLNGNNFAYDKGINCYNDDNGIYFRLGEYGVMDHNATVYYDDIRIGDASATLAEMSSNTSSVASGDNNSSSDTTTIKLDAPTLEVVQTP